VLDAWRPRGNVHTLVTSRIGNWRLGVSPIEVDAWALAEALAYLVRETGRADLSETELSKLAETLGRLPLALSHAAAYLRRRKAVTIQDYLGDLDRHMSELPKDAEYQSPVYATFRAALRQAEQEAAGATALMSLAAFFAPDGIPEELFQQDAALYPPDLEPVVAKPAHLADTLGVLDDLSIIDFKPATRTFSTHRIVQAAARDALGPDRDAWAQRAIGIAFSAFPQPAPETWPQCARLVAHVRALNAHVPAEAATRELGWLLGTAGEYSRERAALADVLPLFRASHDIFERLATADPENGGSQRDLAVSHGKIGDMLRIQGNLPDALAAYKASLAIAERLATTGPENAVWQRDLSIANDYIGDVLRAQGNLSGALTAYKASLAIVDRLATADPGNAGWQRDLSVSQERIGDVLVEQSNLPDALVAYNASLAIRERLATADPGNAGWQRDLSVSHDKIGDVLVQKGNLTDALAAYKASHAIAERLATADPGNAGWQRDLSVSHSKIGDVLVQQGNLPDALAAYKASLAIAERLATADPGNAGWQRDVAISNERLGDIYLRQENSIEARQAFERALGAYEALITRNPSDVPSQVYSVLPRWRLSHLDPRNARRHLESALAILNPLAAAGRLDANRLGWIAEIEGELSEL
jgi:tetratricopeptide (TPR) repeat protein